MPGPVWNGDDPVDATTIAANAADLVAALAADAGNRRAPTLESALHWHERLYENCSVPHPGYVGRFRGDPTVPELVGYEVGIGALQPDGLPDRVGVWSADVAVALQQLMPRIAAGVAVLDGALPLGTRPSSAEELSAIVKLAALIHCEWVRIHPFANGNGRTARVWVAWLCVRYDLPVFVTLKPRPAVGAYAAAARVSMGRPPDFAGEHGSTEAVFAHLLALSLRR